ncbi:hypothetical protein ABLN72_17875, partial [Mycobacterium tuberculosis]
PSCTSYFDLSFGCLTYKHPTLPLFPHLSMKRFPRFSCRFQWRHRVAAPTRWRAFLPRLRRVNDRAPVAPA